MAEDNQGKNAAGKNAVTRLFMYHLQKFFIKLNIAEKKEKILEKETEKVAIGVKSRKVKNFIKKLT